MKSCVDRKEHMIKEFQKINVSQYTFIEAVDGNTSEEVQQLIKSGKAKIFRNTKRQRRFGNGQKQQIGNWLSHIKVWKTIIKEKHLLTLICEDDLFFVKSANKTASHIFSEEWMSNHKVNLKKPVLFRLGYGRATIKGEFERKYKLGFNKKKKVSNPCYAISLSCAKKLISSLKKIRCTSDRYVHKIMANKWNHFTITPPLGHDLSSSIGEFQSKIRPIMRSEQR